jgi:hypothetical protein
MNLVDKILKYKFYRDYQYLYFTKILKVLRNYLLNTLLLIYLFIILIVSTPSSFAQCDPLITPSDNPTLKYQKRNNRCEGTYTAKVASVIGIELVGFYRNNFVFRDTITEIIKLKTNYYSSCINVRAVGIRINSFYRMDTEILPNEVLNWNTSTVLYRARLKYTDIGVFGWIGNEKDKTYIPLNINTSINNANNQILQLVFRTKCRAREFKWRYKKTTDASFNSFSSLGSVQKGVPILVNLPTMCEGNYIIEVFARTDELNGPDVRQYKLIIP